MTQLFFTKPLQSHRHHQWLDKKCGKPCGTVATTCYFSQNEAVTFSSIANIFNYLANRNLFTMCEKKKRIKRLSHGQGAPNINSSTIVLIFELCRHLFLQLVSSNTMGDITVYKHCYYYSNL